MPNISDAAGVFVGATGVNAIYVNGVKVWPVAPAGPPVPVVIQTTTMNLVSQVSPPFTFSAGVQTGDVILFFTGLAFHTSTLAATTPAGWVNLIGAGAAMIISAANAMSVHYHVVTSGENGQTNFTIPNLFASGPSGSGNAYAIRGADPVNPIDNYGTATGAGTPHTLPAITGTGGLLQANSLVVRAVTKDAIGTYTTPAGHTVKQVSVAPDARTWSGIRDAPTTANTDVAATNITVSASDEYASVSIAFAGISV